MTSSSIEADSLLALDVGSITTRALLFDVVDGRYRFLASGEALTTAGAPFHDIGEGVRLAIDRLHKISGRIFVDENERLILPSRGDGSGVDTFAASISAGPPLKIVTVGLLEDISLESAYRLAMTTYGNVLDTISLNDHRKPEARIDAILQLRPDLIIVAGGTEDGASQSVLNLLESVGLACYLLPETLRPEILYAGNQALQQEVKTSLEKLANLHFASNIRPALDVEQIDVAQTKLAEIYNRIRSKQIPGIQELNDWAKGHMLPSAAGFGRLIRFLSKAYSSSKGVLGVDIGASATTLAAAFSGNLVLGSYPHLGLGSGLPGLLNEVELDEITRWLPVELPKETVRDYIYNKSIYPASLPVTVEELAIEQVLARLVLQIAIRTISKGYPPGTASLGKDLLPWFEPIVATGSVLTHAPNLAQTTLILLDGLQPTGVTTLVLDQNHLLAVLGVAAGINPTLVTQVLDSTTIQYLGTVISPVGNARPGTPILRLTITYESGHESTVDVKQGSLEVLPLPQGQVAKLYLQPLHRYNVGMGGTGRGGRLNVHGGMLGVIIDARGRPVQLPEDPARRRDLFKKWLWTLGG